MRNALRNTMLAALLIVVAAGCRDQSDTEVRTFRLVRMTHESALPLLTPYVGEGGTITGNGGVITVRAQPEEIERIAEVLARYDGRPAQVRVSVHVLEAGDFEATSNLPFESTLRELLPYEGYRLIDDVEFRATEWSRFSRDGLGTFAIEGEVTEVQTEAPASATIHLRVQGRTEERLGEEIRGTVNAPLGETIVVATHRSGGAGPALVVALRADLIDESAARSATSGESPPSP